MQDELASIAMTTYNEEKVMQSKLVSIAMATYNGEKFLREQLDSIYNQTYKNIEIIVCDDCSTDTTVEILEEYKQKYGLRYYINEKNLGYIKNFEKALSLCSGDYIAFSDQDDVWLPEKLETLVNEIKGKSLIHSDSTLIDENNKITALSLKESNKSKQFALESNKNILNVSFIAGHSCLFAKELLEKAFPIPHSEFHDSWIPIIASKLNGIKYLDRPLVLFRQHSTNTSTVKNRFFYTFYLKFGIYIFRAVRKIRRIIELKKRGL